MQTTNWDGESALKPREIIPLLQGKFTKESFDCNTSILNNSHIEIEPPSNNIYKCNGSIELSTGEKSFIQVENILLRGTTLKNTDYVYGIWLYTGKDTKIMKNIQSSSIKSSSIEDIINTIIIGIIIFVFILCWTCSIAGFVYTRNNLPDYIQGHLNSEYIFYYSHYKGKTFNLTLEFLKIFGAFFILINNIIPISLAITFTIAKVVQIIIIEFDPDWHLNPTDQLKVWSTRWQEDLGKIKYIFTDKTGTLTRNEMVFKGCSIYSMWFYESTNINREDEWLKELRNSFNNSKNINNQYSNNTRSKSNYNITGKENSKEGVVNIHKNEHEESLNTFDKWKYFLENELPIPVQFYDEDNSPIDNIYSNSREAVFDFLLNITLNHSVLSEYDEIKKTYHFQGPNPDEVALVSTAKEIGVEFMERIGKDIKIKLVKTDEILVYEILQVFAYTSERKRSGIIVKDKSKNKIKWFVKGADEKLYQMSDYFSDQHLHRPTKEHLDIFAKNGLRTLCYGSRYISKNEYDTWSKDYEKLKNDAWMDTMKLTEVEEKIKEIENDIIWVGVSGLEDRWQDEVREDIAKFIESGIQVWMITGDQMDTAESIGYSSNFFENDTEVYKIKSGQSMEIIKENMLRILKEIQIMEKQWTEYKIAQKNQPKIKKKNTFDQGNTPQFERKIQYNMNIIHNNIEITPIKEDVKGEDGEANEKTQRKKREDSNFKLENYQSADPNAYTHRIYIEDSPNNKSFQHNKINKNNCEIDSSLDDADVMKFMYEQKVFGENANPENEAHTFIKCIVDDKIIGMKKSTNQVNMYNENKKEDNKDDNIKNNLDLINTPDDLFTHYKTQLNKIIEKKQTISKISRIASFNFNIENEGPIGSSETLSLLNFGLVIEGNALVHCLHDDIREIFWNLIQKSRSIICCRCTPVQKSEIVGFVKEKSKKLCLAIGDGGNDVNMIKRANVGVGIFGKEGHQAAYNSDYAIAQFKYWKHLLFYHGRYIWMRNSYFIYFFFYKGLIFCCPEIWFAFHSLFSGSNVWDFVWFTMYTGLVSTMPPVIVMVFEEDIDVSFDDNPNKSMLVNWLPDIYREYRDSNPFNVFKYFTVFILSIVQSVFFYFWCFESMEYSITDSSGRQFGMWDFSNVCMWTVLIVQFLVLMIDTNKFYIWVYIAHAIQILINLVFWVSYSSGNTDELGAYSFDTMSNIHFWLILLGSVVLCMAPIYFSRYFDYLFNDTIINNLRNKKTDIDFAQKMFIKKIENMTKYTRSLAKFKKIYNALHHFKADNFADRKMREIVSMYKENRMSNRPTPRNNQGNIWSSNSNKNILKLSANSYKSNGGKEDWSKIINNEIKKSINKNWEKGEQRKVESLELKSLKEVKKGKYNLNINIDEINEENDNFNSNNKEVTQNLNKNSWPHDNFDEFEKNSNNKENTNKKLNNSTQEKNCNKEGISMPFDNIKLQSNNDNYIWAKVESDENISIINDM